MPLPLSSAQQKIAALLKLHPQCVDLSLGRMARLLCALGNPQKKLPPIIHIAGTNGKGSAAAFSRAFLEAGGYSAHIYTSPHLLHWHERYRLGSKDKTGIHSACVSDTLLAETLEHVTYVNNGQDITVFEVLTAAAFVLFSQYPADALVLETGLGGRYDATNIIETAASSLIMPIDFDHQAFLGKTIAAIAAEKGGIIKKNTPLTLAKQPHRQAIRVLQQQARQQSAPISLYGNAYHMRIKGKHIFFSNSAAAMKLPLPRLAGRFQAENAAAALQAVLSGGFIITEQAAAEAMRNVAWPARLQRLTGGKLLFHAPKGADLWLDGAHNPAAAAIIAAAFAPMLRETPFFIICGMLQTKDSLAFLQQFIPLRPKIWTIPLAHSSHAVPPAELAATARSLGMPAQSAASASAALQAISAALTADSIGTEEARQRKNKEQIYKAKKTENKQAAPDIKKHPSAIILICGSLYLAGEILAENGAHS